MVLNKKGQIIFYKLMLAIIVIILALSLAAPTKEFTDSARNETTNLGGQGLNCTSSTLSDFDQGACMIVDLTQPYFIGALIFIGVSILTIKLIWG